MIHPVTDEILERLWYAKEEGKTSVRCDDAEAVAELVRLNHIAVVNDGITLLSAGDTKARGIVRRHRLAEILFTQVLGAELKEAERSACEFEHILAESVVDRVCAFLGHPPSCPHGKPIPSGDCCGVYSKTCEPLITRLVDLPLGSSGAVVFIAPKSVSRLNKLAAFGVVPGISIRLLERKPSVVFSCGHTSIAVEDEIGREIYVRPVNP